MPEERKIQMALLAAPDDPRSGAIRAVLSAAGFEVTQRVSASARLVLILPGSGGPGFVPACVEIVQAHPTTPVVVFHSGASEHSHPALADLVFEALPASFAQAPLADRLRAVLARWQRFEELKTSAATLQQLESVTELVYFDFRPDTGTFRPSPQMRALLGLDAPAEGLEPSSLLDRIHSEDRALFAGTLFEAARSGTPFCVPIRLRDAEDRQRHFRTRGRAFGATDSGHSAWVFGVCEDTTEHMEQLAVAEARSRIDELTGLGNRRFFDDCLSSTIERARRERNRLALMYVDLDRFKLINDTLGHDAGDHLLRVISARLSDAVRAQDIVCIDQEDVDSSVRISRLGGDEFTVLLSGIHSAADAEIVANRLLEAIRQPIEVVGQILTPAASLGIALYPDDGRSGEELRKRADSALYAAKANGGGYRFFARSMEDGKVRRLSLEHELRGAVDRGELTMTFQPRIDYRTGQTIGAEAVPRWESPQIGRVPAPELLRVAEETGFGSTLGRWLLTQACREGAYWAASSRTPCRLVVPVNASSFQKGDAYAFVIDALMQTGFPPDRLEVQIHEGLLLIDEARVGQTLEELRRIGVRIALDGFGRGVSPLALLMDQPIDVLKLDRRLIETIAPDGDGSRLLANVIRMACDLSLHPVADGVSQPDQAAFLVEHGCHEMQGFLFAEPLAPDAFRERLGCL